MSASGREDQDRADPGRTAGHVSGRTAGRLSGPAPGGTSGRIASGRAAGGASGRISRWSLRTVALGYLLVLLIAPVAMIFYRTFEHGLAPVWHALTRPDALHAMLLSLEMVAIAVPLNTVFGIAAALSVVRGRSRLRPLLGVLIDLPFALSPVVVGLSLLLVYGIHGWFGTWLVDHGIRVIFSIPGMVIATCFVSLPFVARECIPTLRELGTEPEQAAATLGASSWQTFWRVTLPAIRWAAVYGVVLTTARALGEFGALSVVSGNVEGVTQTLPLYVDDRFSNYDLTGAYAGAMVLALMALAVLALMSLLTRRTRPRAAGSDGNPSAPAAPSSGRRGGGPLSMQPRKAVI